MNPVFYVIIGIVAVAIIAGIVFVVMRYRKINANGIETTATISRIKEVESNDSDGTRTVNYEYYVKYKNQAGETIEAKLGSAPRFAQEGDEVKIKYLPEKPKYVIRVKD